MGALHIWPETPARRDGHVVLSATIEAPDQERSRLWYSIPESLEGDIAQNADPFVIGTIYLLMQSGHEVRVHGEVSPSLLWNLEEFQGAWTSWEPGLKKVPIRADNEKEPEFQRNSSESIVAFSGGVDSCFTAFHYTRNHGLAHPSPLTAGVMMHGFDIPLSQPEVFASALKRSRAMLSSLDLELIPIATNYRELVTDWVHSFGAATASCLCLFSKRFRAGYISQGLTFNDFHLLHEGSNPLTDPLLSSDSFSIVPTGSAYNRASKIFAMREWDEFLRYLRVCWQGPNKDQNCCECEKCMRNILTFRALGLGLPPCFPKDVDERMIQSLSLGAGHLPEMRYSGLKRLATSHGAQGSWLDVIDKRLAYIRRNRRAENSWILRQYLRFLRKGKKLMTAIIRNRG
ncbi:MAG: hypothetical protein PVG49_06265 [Desulfobacteraceae bacterium]